MRRRRFRRTLKLHVLSLAHVPALFLYVVLFDCSAMQDVGDAATALDEPRFSAFKQDAFFSPSSGGGGSASQGGGNTPEAWSTREFGSAMDEAASRQRT